MHFYEFHQKVANLDEKCQYLIGKYQNPIGKGKIEMGNAKVGSGNGIFRLVFGKVEQEYTKVELKNPISGEKIVNNLEGKA